MARRRNDGTDISSTLARQWEYMREAEARACAEWEDLGACGDDYSKYRHTKCGTVMRVLLGVAPVCPKCQPEEWAKSRDKK